MQSNKSQVLLKFASQFSRKFASMMVVDVMDETCYDLKKCLDAEQEIQSYVEWMRLFLEVEVVPEQQSQFASLLKSENITRTLNSSNYLVTVLYRNRLDINSSVWRRMWLMLLDSDGYGIAKTFIIAQELVSSKTLAQEPSYYSSDVFGVVKFSYDPEMNKVNRTVQFTNVNDRALQIFGYTSEEFYEEVVNEGNSLVSPADYPGFMMTLKRLETPGDKTPFSLDIINRGGFLVHVTGEMQLCEDEHGQIYVQSIFYNSSKGEELKLTVADLTYEIDNIARTVPGGLHRNLVSGHNEIYYVSKMFQDITGYDVNDMRIRFGGSIKGMMADPESSAAYDSAFSKALMSGKPVTAEFKIKTAGKEIRTVREWMVVTHDKIDKLWLYGYMQDISVEKKLENKINISGNVSAGTTVMCTLIQKISDVCLSEKLANEKQKHFLDAISEAVQGRLFVYSINSSDKKSIKIYGNDSQNATLTPEMIGYFSEDRTKQFIGCKIFSNRILLKSVVAADKFSEIENGDLNSLIVMPFEQGIDKKCKYVAIMENPASWVFQEQFAKTLNSLLLMNFPISND